MKQKRLTDFNQIYEVCRDELKANKKRSYYDFIIDVGGSIGVVYECLENMLYHGRFMYPETYKYRKELTKHYKAYIKEHSKMWIKTDKY